MSREYVYFLSHAPIGSLCSLGSLRSLSVISHVRFHYYRIIKILSNILYPIEYSYGSTEISTIDPTFSIAYSIYSTSQYLVIVFAMHIYVIYVSVSKLV